MSSHTCFAEMHIACSSVATAHSTISTATTAAEDQAITVSTATGSTIAQPTSRAEQLQLWPQPQWLYAVRAWPLERSNKQ